MIPLDTSFIRPGDRVCAAVSGGADSVALLLLLHAANAQPRNALGVGLSAVHVHHGLRGDEADADLAFVQALCARLEVPLHLRRASVPDRIARSRELRQPHESVEEAARNLRYDFFASLISAGEADSVLTAHTLDDQAETVLMKLLRGAWTEGLSGIHPMILVDGPIAAARTIPGGYNFARDKNPAGRILRPLLGVRHAELEDYLRAHNQPWRNDSSNTDEAFTRNRIRHHLLPILREYNPNLDQALANLAELAREDEARWQSELSRVLPQILLPGRPVRGGGRAVSTAPGDSDSQSKAKSVALELERLRALDPAMRRRVLRAAARQLGTRLTFDETSRLLAVAGFLPHSTTGDAVIPARPCSTLDLPGRLRAERSAREILLHRPVTPKNV